jgi:hypothetical protein
LNKIIMALMAINFLGDPDLQYLAWLGDLKLCIVAAAIALVSMPGSLNSSTADPLSVTAPTPFLRKAASVSPVLLNKKAPQSIRGAELFLCVAGY